MNALKKYSIGIICGVFAMTTITVGVAAMPILANPPNSNPENDLTPNDKFVPLWNSALLREDSESFNKERNLVAKPVDNSDNSIDNPVSNSVDNSVDNRSIAEPVKAVVDDTQLGKELREILSRKPEIPAKKIPTKNKVVVNNNNNNSTNNNSERTNDTQRDAAVVLAQSKDDPLAGRPDPPQGNSPNLSAIPSVLIDDPPAAATNTSPITPTNNAAPQITHHPTNEPIKNSTTNPQPRTPTIINKNDFASVINGWLLVATIVSVAALVYVSIIAVDYHQRWMQSLTAQNDRYAAIDDLAYSGLHDQYDASDGRNFGTDFFRITQ
ncbi:MAG: hypothetical protein LBJ00_16150 [Planctomycetaceae bacterium]|jgi:hypothetical protein|nr:hypothetical protein [Planctomycetaceae bacterium]